VGNVGARHIAIVRFLCTFGSQFSISDLHRNAIHFNGHHFLLTIFKIKCSNEARVPLYYCRCGEVAVQDEVTRNFVGLTGDNSHREGGSCSLGNHSSENDYPASRG
jgi:hypothetical protein